MSDTVALLAKAKAPVEAVSFDNNGTMVAGHFVSGNGGLLSRDTIKASDSLQLEMARFERVASGRDD